MATARCDMVSNRKPKRPWAGDDCGAERHVRGGMQRTDRRNLVPPPHRSIVALAWAKSAASFARQNRQIGPRVGKTAPRTNRGAAFGHQARHLCYPMVDGCAINRTGGEISSADHRRDDDVRRGLRRLRHRDGCRQVRPSSGACQCRSSCLSSPRTSLFARPSTR